jgi:hypothetical protein
METKGQRKRRKEAERQAKRRRRLQKEEAERVPVFQPEAELDKYFRKLLTIKVLCSTTDKAIKMFHTLVVDMAETLAELKASGCLPRDTSKVFAFGQSLTPPVLTDITVRRKTEDLDRKGREIWTQTTEERLPQIPQNLLRQDSSQQVDRIVSYMPVKDIMKQVANHHPGIFANGPPSAYLSSDGIPESHGGTMSLKVFISCPLFMSFYSHIIYSVVYLQIISLAFLPCLKAYPVMAISYRLKGDKVTPDDTLRYVVNEIQANGIKLEAFVADAPERFHCKGLRGHTGRYSCDVCTSRGTEVNRYYRHRFASSIMSEKRTLEETKSIALSGIDPANEAAKGVKAYSPLFDLPNFDVFLSKPVDSMHNQDKGLTCQIINRVLLSGDGPERRELTARFDSLLHNFKGIREMSRRLRPLKFFTQYKANELQVIGLCIFPYFFGQQLNDFDTTTTDEDFFW